jgi:hypothetical protein
MGMKIYVIGIIVVFTLVLSSIALTPTTALQASSKGLKLYLTVDTNLNDDVRINTYQHGDRVFTHNADIHSGSNEVTLQYPSGLIDTGINDMTDNSCELVIRGEKSFCPSHPDIVACVDFLNNATNKQTESPLSVCAGMGDPRTWVICPQESNPEGYCIMTNNTVFCKTIGDL